MTKVYQSESGYQDLLVDILQSGVDVPDRTGLGRRKLFGVVWTHNMQDGFCAFTARPNNPVFLGMKEFWFFLNGLTQTRDLELQKVKFWEGHTSREFLDSRELSYLPAGSYGKAYGFQLRHFGGDLEVEVDTEGRAIEGTDPVPKGGYDQLEALVKNLKENPFDSRHVVTMWNPAQLHEMALPPCWHSHQFLAQPYTHKPLLNLSVSARSCDVLFGTPMNVAQYGFYLQAMANLVDMVPGRLTVYMTDAHLYGNQFDYARETASRQIYASPQIEIQKKLSSLEDFLNLVPGDVSLSDYQINSLPYVYKRPQLAI